MHVPRAEKDKIMKKRDPQIRLGKNRKHSPLAKGDTGYPVASEKPFSFRNH